MDERLLFNEALSSLMEYATVNGNQLTKEDVKKYFKDILKEESQYHSVYTYLIENKIKIKDIDITVSTSSSVPKHEKEEAAILEMYQADLAARTILNEEEQHFHFQQLKNGNVTSRQILTEHFLQSVLDIVPHYQNQGVSTADLIQEGNLSILLALSACENWESVDSAIEQAIHTAMQKSIDEQNGNDRIDNHLVSRINALNDATTLLAKRFEREPTLEELSRHLSLPEEEIQTLMKISMDALTTYH